MGPLHVPVARQSAATPTHSTTAGSGRARVTTVCRPRTSHALKYEPRTCRRPRIARLRSCAFAPTPRRIRHRWRQPRVRRHARRTPSIRRACFIGKSAQRAFVSHHKAHLAAGGTAIALAGGRLVELMVLPSRSRACAIPAAQKLAAWVAALRP